MITGNDEPEFVGLKNPTNQQDCRTHDNGIKNRRRLWGTDLTCQQN